MSDQVLILRRDRPLDFVADACAALADSVNELPVSRVGDQLLIETYAEMLRAYSNLLRPALVGDPGLCNSSQGDRPPHRTSGASPNRRDQHPAA
jgi:hypothetical protein